jgi:hypothetical protein
MPGWGSGSATGRRECSVWIDRKIKPLASAGEHQRVLTVTEKCHEFGNVLQVKTAGQLYHQSIFLIIDAELE